MHFCSLCLILNRTCSPLPPPASTPPHPTHSPYPRPATFLFANVIASGIKIIINGDPLTRRSRFILACSLALAFGVELVPQWATLNLWPITPSMSPGLRGLRDAIILVLSTSFTFGAVTAIILNLIIPSNAGDATATGAGHGERRPTRGSLGRVYDSACWACHFCWRSSSVQHARSMHVSM